MSRRQSGMIRLSPNTNQFDFSNSVVRMHAQINGNVCHFPRIARFKRRRFAGYRTTYVPGGASNIWHGYQYSKIFGGTTLHPWERGGIENKSCRLRLNLSELFHLLAAHN